MHINLYELPTGVFCAPQSLTADEAVELHNRRILQATDYELLSFDAAFAVQLEMEAAVRGAKSTGAVVFWGVRKPIRASQGRA